MDRGIKIYIILAIIVLLIVAGIIIIKNLLLTEPEEEVMKCIAEKSVLYSQLECSHCKAQKELLGNYLNLFNIIECDENNDNLEKCRNEEITSTPTWMINGKKYVGYKTIKELKELTGC